MAASDVDPQPGDAPPGVIDAATIARIRAEESARLEVRAALAPRTPHSRFDKLVALSNTNIGIGTIGALVIGVAGWTYAQVDDAIHRSERAAADARARALADIQNVTPFLTMLAKQDSPERKLACRVVAYMIATRAINDDLGQGLATEAGECLRATLKHAGTDDTGGVETRAAAHAVSAAIAPTSTTADKVDGVTTANAPALSTAQLALARALPKRIYIQVADASQTAAVAELRSAYEKEGWIVPPTETVGAKASSLQVRYFNAGDEAAARHTLDLIDAIPALAALPHARAPTARLSLKAPPGQIEVWLPRQP